MRFWALAGSVLGDGFVSDLGLLVCFALEGWCHGSSSQTV